MASAHHGDRRFRRPHQDDIVGRGEIAGRRDLETIAQQIGGAGERACMRLDGGAFGAEPWIDLDRGYAAFLVLEATSGQGQALMNEIRPMVDRIMDERAGRPPAGS